MTASYDIIGDIHGHAEELEALLSKLGYRERQGAFRHPEGRHAIYVGDLIDRGPEQLRAVAIARSMQDAGTATVLMGNHEFNAVGWATSDPSAPGTYLRKHENPAHRRQHEAFLVAVGENSLLHTELVVWMRSLPLWLELEGFRVIHACWHAPSLAVLKPHLTDKACLKEEGWLSVHAKGTAPRDALEIVLKGIETRLPDGHSFLDKDGNTRREARVKWWDVSARTIREAAILEDEVARHQLPDSLLPAESLVDYDGEKPVFFGHYWLRAKEPILVTETMACLDYSVAKKGHLLAYRWDGEPRLHPSKLVWV